MNFKQGDTSWYGAERHTVISVDDTHAHCKDDQGHDCYIPLSMLSDHRIFEVTISEFEEIVKRHSLNGDLNYNTMALSGEVGEVANQVKKIHMSIVKPEWVLQNDNALPDTDEFKENARNELGDVLFYLFKVMNLLGTNMYDVMERQSIKLELQTDLYKRTFLK